MVRKTALVAAMLGVLSSHAFAMGLGEIKLNSVLNQPLDADIELLSPTAADLAALRVILASPAAYNRAGVEREFFHTKLNFSVVTRPDGSAYVKVSSREPVREPYLDFLIEATWGSGQVLREYTVLVDPPAMMPAPAPVTRAPSISAAPAPAPAPRQAAPAPAPRPVQQYGYQGGDYRTQRNDTLWEIAEQVRPDSSVSMEQTMLGLLEANPDAFYDQNINNLKAGFVMRVPSAAEMAAISHAEAQAEVRRQNRLWREGRSAGTPTTAGTDAATAAPSAAAGDQSAQTGSGAQLKLLAPDVGEAAGANAGSVQQLRQELTMAVEAMEAQKQENQELNTRLVELEDQIAKLHRLLELKDSELAQLGGIAAPAPDAEVATAPSTDAASDAAPVTDSTTAVPGETVVGDMPEGESAVADGEPVEAPVEQMAQTDETVEPVEAAPVDEPDTVAEVPPPPPVVPETTTEPAPAGEAVEQQSFLDMLLANPMLKWGAIGGGLLVALLAWMGIRRKRMDDSSFQESILADRGNAATRAAAAAGLTGAAAAGSSQAAVADDSDVAEAPVAADTTPSQEVASQTDSSLFTDFAVSDMGAIQNDEEADPIAEADVYLAYGRYQQAEELVRSAIERSPQRNDLKLKLLEVLFAAKNTTVFDTEAEALLANLDGQDDELWQRVAEMGQELNPGNPMYKADGAAAAAASIASAAAATAAVASDNDAAETLDMDAGLDMDTGMDMDTGVDMDSGLDMDAGLDMSAATDDLEQSLSSTAESGAAATQEDNSLDFDLGELESFDKDTAQETPAIPADDDLNFDLSSATEAQAPADEDADGELAASDEVATKLDLARAYMEMGDPDGARSILEEVMEEGNDAQKSEAQTLLQKVS